MKKRFKAVSVQAFLQVEHILFTLTGCYLRAQRSKKSRKLKCWRKTQDETIFVNVVLVLKTFESFKSCLDLK